jgi:hypothetical protein
MCLFKRKKMIEIDYSDRVFLGFAINNYGGSSNLRGCINDIDDAQLKLNSLYPNFQFVKFKDKEVKKDIFKYNLAKAISALPKNATVCLVMDCCFSGSITRSNVVKQTPKFKPSGILPNMGRIKHIAKETTSKWIVLSGCAENQTSSDALINNRYNGAFTWVALNTIKRGMSYRDWFEAIRKQLPSAIFEQSPTIEGAEYLTGRIIGDGPTLIVWYSGHGTYVTDHSGDEADGYDEALALRDGNLVDDDIHYILKSIK